MPVNQIDLKAFARKVKKAHSENEEFFKVLKKAICPLFSVMLEISILMRMSEYQIKVCD